MGFSGPVPDHHVEKRGPGVEHRLRVGVQVAAVTAGSWWPGDPLQDVQVDPASAIHVRAVWRRPWRTRPGLAEVARRTWSQFVASRRVAVVMTPPRGPATSRVVGALGPR